MSQPVEGENVNQDKQESVEIDLIGRFDSFLRKWTGENFAHLIDSDENDGERFRQLLREQRSKADALRQELSTTKAQLEVCRVALENISKNRVHDPADNESGCSFECHDGICHEREAECALYKISTTQPLNSLRRLVESVDRMIGANENEACDDCGLGESDDVIKALAEVKKEFGL